MKIIIKEKQFNWILDSLLNESIHSKRKEFYKELYYEGKELNTDEDYIQLYLKLKNSNLLNDNKKYIDFVKNKYKNLYNINGDINIDYKDLSFNDKNELNFLKIYIDNLDLEKINEIYMSLVDKYINLFEKYKKRGFLKDNDGDLYSLRINLDIINSKYVRTITKDLENIDSYKQFSHLKKVIDYFKNQDKSESTPVDIGMDDSETLVDDDVIKIQRGNTGQGCINIKGDFPADWCVASSQHNLHATHRFNGNEPTFYFVQNKELFNNLNIETYNDIKLLNDEEKYCFFVLQVTKENKYIVTSAKNDGDEKMSWEDIINIYPELNEYKDYFNVVPISDIEKHIGKRKSTTDDYNNLNYHEKIIYFKTNPLTDEQFKYTRIDLLEEYVKGHFKLTKGQKMIVYKCDNYGKPIDYTPNEGYSNVAKNYKYNNYQLLFHENVDLDTDLVVFFIDEFYLKNLNFLKEKGISYENWFKNLSEDVKYIITNFCREFYKDPRSVILFAKNLFGYGQITFKCDMNFLNDVYELHMNYLKENNIDWIYWYNNTGPIKQYLKNIPKFKEDKIKYGVE